MKLYCYRFIDNVIFSSLVGRTEKAANGRRPVCPCQGVAVTETSGSLSTSNQSLGTAFLSSTATHLSGAPEFPPLCADWPPRHVDGENRNHLMETSGRACKTDALVFGGAKRRECTGAAVKLSVEIFCTKRSHVSIVRQQALSV